MLRTILVLVTALAVAVPQTADACGNPIHLAGNRATQKVKNYENWLKAGHNAKILRDAHRFEIQEGSLRDRAHLVIAVAALRSNSSLPWTMRHALDEGEDDSPLGVLRKLAKAAPDSPVVQARFAEALLKERLKEGGEGFAAEATKILEDLATREVMPDAEAWNSLALARSLAKDETGSAAAKAQCKKLARGRKHACK